MKSNTQNEVLKLTKVALIKRSALELFREFGFNKISIEEICELASASKMTFYRNFKNKGDLLRQIFAELAVLAQQQAEAILARDESFRHKFDAIIKLNEEFRERLGYRLVNDLMNSADPEIKAIEQENASRIRELNLRFIAAGKASGFFRTDFSDEFMLFLSEKLKDILADKRFTTFYPDFSQGLTAVTRYFYFGVATDISEKL
jgi:AcrR family transcriptional regulator